MRKHQRSHEKTVTGYVTNENNPNRSPERTLRTNRRFLEDTTEAAATHIHV